MSRGARFWAGLAGAGVMLLAGCDSSGGDQPPPTSLGGTSGGGAPSAGTTLPPAPRVFDTGALQNGVRQVLTQSYGLTDVTGVRCPSGQAVQVGVSFDCAVTVAGEPKSVTLTVQTADGTYQVSAPK
ncbi:DUF4333 domain-containing protein [Amycolatopsis alkalitolerans]|uniref:DUF4333 domain-containing protein n=1 Tax=Amycolatopsis alkalitolerans TaxID=2547244 RepID=UPI001358D1C4|nr:DUF4333 domain-containing protein [Amycolatopsis alkalitolerans]